MYFQDFFCRKVLTISIYYDMINMKGGETMIDRPMNNNIDYPAILSNQIIKAKQSMTLREMQLFLLAVSSIKPDDTVKESYRFTISAVDLAKVLDISTKSLYRDLKRISENLMNRKIDMSQLTGNEFDCWNLCRNATYTKNHEFSILLEENLNVFFCELRKRYTTLQLKAVFSFKSYYTIRLYQLIVCEYGERGKTDYSFTPDEIRDFFGVPDDKYKSNIDLVKKTLKTALDELTATGYCSISGYTENKSGKRGNPLESVSFTARPI